MDQKGYTKYGYAHLSDMERIEYAIKNGCKYLILREDQLESIETIHPFLKNKIGQYHNLIIFSL